ncbi:MAG: hypothetical protein CXZ00_13025 [Acidobacteria bacterium]|nr:MAG: hypothetical protein CXZ00_13025 [Acidobacteriota bacterium]
MSPIQEFDNLQLRQRMSEGWYGYGRWEAPFWFIGIEPGGKNAEAPMLAWQELGGGELLDCRKHHLHPKFGYTRFQTPPFALQPTWRRLMLLLFAFEKRDISTERLKQYQAERWGSRSETGETCVIEVSPTASQQQSKNVQQSLFTIPRIEHVREMVEKHQPTFVVLYSSAKRLLPTWERIAGRSFDSDNMTVSGRTVFIVTPHPVAFRYTDEEWIQFGVRLRNRCQSNS